MMDRTTTIGGNTPLGSNMSDPATNARVEAAAQTAHRTVDSIVDSIADKATGQVGRLSGTAHRAVNTAADAATSAAEWASSVPEQAKQVQTKITEAACDSIRARPLSTVAGALVFGYLLGRLARL
jgi:ElaB/YqjD/DUF883 family membrane-anchored ribosome-binding protein